MGKNYLDLYQGNCLEVMKSAPDNSIDAVVTDPPYGLSFMGKKWDYDVPSVEIWREVFRVLKPGGHLLAFGGTRTYHRLVVNIEDAGFEIRDQIQWLYGQGFPKSLDVSKAIDKAAGAEREKLGVKQWPTQKNGRSGLGSKSMQVGTCAGTVVENFHTAPSTDAAKQWEGWGTALKPANEPIVLARKPLEKGLTVAQNVQKWGTGAINIDATRVATAESLGRQQYEASSGNVVKNSYYKNQFVDPSGGKGRFPANVILDETAAAALDSSLRSDGAKAPEQGVSRFFYVAKASTSERNAGCKDLPSKEIPLVGVPIPWNAKDGTPNKSPVAKNFHPTVKPIKLMEYLCRLVTPPGGIVLDPFMGSGTTGIAAGNEGFGFIGIELSPEYFEIAQKRIKREEDDAA